jgi:hypothetical protein
MFTPKNPLSINDCHTTAVNSAVIAVTAVTPSERFKTHLVYT